MSKKKDPAYGITHDQVWTAIDRLAGAFGYSASGLARQAGLDPTSFNPSKRINADGKPRWPSTESIARVLAATGATMADFLSLMDEAAMREASPAMPRFLPAIGLSRAGSKGAFDADGRPATGAAWDEIQFPAFTAQNDTGLYALKIDGNAAQPLCRDGDYVIVSSSAAIKKGDRVVVKTKDGTVMIQDLARRSSSRIDLKALDAPHTLTSLSPDRISWMSRILWVSQ